jgi:hypothetical protein
MNSSSLPILDGGSSALPCRCGLRKYSNTNSAVSTLNSGARAFSQVQAEGHWGHALAGTLNGEALLAEGTQTAIWVTATCIRVVDACFATGGGSALYESSPLQRRMRDLHAAAQHVGVQQRHYVNSGKVLLDGPPSIRRSSATRWQGLGARDRKLPVRHVDTDERRQSCIWTTGVQKRTWRTGRSRP